MSFSNIIIGAGTYDRRIKKSKNADYCKRNGDKKMTDNTNNKDIKPKDQEPIKEVVEKEIKPKK